MNERIEVLAKKQVCGSELTFYGTVEEPVFLAKDVAGMIGHSNQRMMIQTIDEDEKICVRNPYASSGQQEQWFLTEYGVYEVLMQSTKPLAKQFKKEVKHILHELRVNGTVMSARVAMASPEQQAASFQKAIDAAMEHAFEIADNHYLPEIEKLNREKAWISDKQTATAMATASVYKNKSERLEKENHEIKQEVAKERARADANEEDAVRNRTWRSNMSKGQMRRYHGADYDNSDCEECHQIDLFDGLF